MKNDKLKKPTVQKQLSKVKSLSSFQNLLSPKQQGKTLYTQHRKQNHIMDKSLSKWKSNPNLLMTNSYIKLPGVQSQTIENLVQNLEKQVEQRQKMKSVRSFQHLQKGINKKQAKQQKFTRKSSTRHAVHNVRQQSCSKQMNRVINNLEKMIKLKQNQISILNNELELLKKSMQLKNKKLKEYQRLIVAHRIENKQKILLPKQDYLGLIQKLSQKQKQNFELQQKFEKSKKQNENLEKKIQQLFMNEPSFYKDGNISFNLGQQTNLLQQITSTGENLISPNQLQEQIYQKNIEIYDLKKNIDRLNIKTHYTQAKYQQSIRRINQENNKKNRQLIQKYKVIQKQLEVSKMKFHQIQQIKNAESYQLNYSQSDIDFSLI